MTSASNVPRMLQSPPDPRLIVKDGQLLYDANRDHRHPYLYVVTNHLLDNRSEPFQGRTIVFIQDTTPEAIEAIRTFELELRMPLGPDAAIARTGMSLYFFYVTTNSHTSNAGLFELLINDIIFARDLNGTMAPEDDVLQGFIGDRSVVSNCFHV